MEALVVWLGLVGSGVVGRTLLTFLEAVSWETPVFWNTLYDTYSIYLVSKTVLELLSSHYTMYYVMSVYINLTHMG